MASNARRRESGRNVIRIRGLLEISQMAAHAIHRSAGELATHVALSTGHGHVSTSERERRLGVIELGAEPLRGRVAEGTGGGEPGRRMIRVRGLLEIGQMAPHAIHGRASELPTHVALSASHGHMGASEREFGRGIVIELGAEPLCGGMASSASSGKGGRRVIGVRGLLEIGQMAAHTIHGGAGEVIVCVTLAACRGRMGASQRELGRRIVVELRASPLRRGMASSASSGKAGRRMIRGRGLLIIIQMAAGTIIGNGCKPAANVARHAA